LITIDEVFIITGHYNLITDCYKTTTKVKNKKTK